MKHLFQQTRHDWTHHRPRLACEIAAMICAVAFVVVFASTADQPSPSINAFLLAVQTLGCGCGIVYGALRHSLNIVFLNFVMTAFSIWGLWKILL